MKKNSKKRGISPVIATTLLIAIVVIIALIIFVWFRGIIGDYGEKFGKNIELVCEEVLLGASYSDGMLYVTNDGNVPIFKLNLKIESPGGYETSELNEVVPDWPEVGLRQGGIYSGDISSAVGAQDEIIIMPVLIGTSDKGDKKTYACGEQYGYVIA
ncbi:hypothetical protein KAI04_03735 [Candidatus Pacearchaeota archaeon]|nr:hypothetical protein [Candidatus Pacearchaeota archaeon]